MNGEDDDQVGPNPLEFGVWNVSLSAGCPPRMSLCSPSGLPNRAAYPAICCLVSSLSVVPAGTASTLTSTNHRRAR
jgi:hypothetical protein